MPERVALEWRAFDQLSKQLFYDILRFRQSIFVVEQRSAYPDLDGRDESAWHLLAQLQSDLAGYLRLAPIDGPPALVRIGRVAVSPSLRRQGIGRTLIEQALIFCRERYPLQPIALAAQLRLAPFYESLGFTAASDPYDDFGVAHIEMALRQR